jgi:integrase
MNSHYTDQNTLRSKGVSYLIPGHYIVNTNIWVMDETFFNKDTAVLIVIDLKTTVILGVCIALNKENDKVAHISAHVIKELYEQILENGNNTPKYVHTDQKAEYRKEVILDFFNKYGITPSVAGKAENQVAESINNQIKALTIDVIFDKCKKDNAFAHFKTFTPEKFKKMSLSQKRKSKNYRDFLFHSDFFNKDVHVSEVVWEAVDRFNSKKSQVSQTSYDRKTLNKLDNIVEPSSIELYGTKNTPLGQLIIHENDSSYRTAAASIEQIIKRDTDDATKLQEIQNLVIVRDEYAHQSQARIMQALIFIASQNNQQSEKLDLLLEENAELTKKIDLLNAEREKNEHIQKQKEEARIKRLNRVKRPKTQPFTRELYDLLISSIKGKQFLKARLRAAFTIFAITGIRFQELSLLKVNQIITLLTNYYCPIDRKKRGPSNLKAYLRQSGIALLKDRKDDFDLLIRTKYENTETEEEALNSFVFSAEKSPKKPLSRAFFNDMLNKVLTSFVQQTGQQTEFTTHSFRHNFITELWRDSGDIEFVRQFMGHQKLESTVSYIQNLEETEKLIKINQIDQKANQKNEDLLKVKVRQQLTKKEPNK